MDFGCQLNFKNHVHSLSMKEKKIFWYIENNIWFHFQQILQVFLHLFAKEELASHLPFFFPSLQVLRDFKSLQSAEVVVVVMTAFVRVLVLGTL